MFDFASPVLSITFNDRSCAREILSPHRTPPCPRSVNTRIIFVSKRINEHWLEIKRNKRKYQKNWA
jgi:hypothetical protein